MKEKKRDVEVDLEESFKKLMMKKSFDKITIKMITDGAGVIRPTFYNHFADKYELLEYICCNELFKGCQLLVENNMPYEAILFIFSAIEKNKEFYIEANKVKGQNSFEEIIYSNLVKLFEKYFNLYIRRESVKVDKKLTFTDIAQYYSKGVTFIIQKWMESGGILSSKDIYEKYNLLLNNSFEEIIQKL